MWRCSVCVLVLLALCPDVDGSLGDELAETTQLCCNQGTAYARNHTSDDCSSSIPPDVPTAFGSLCIFAMDQCCKEYFQKKKDCEAGVELAMTSDRCPTGSNKHCCDECIKGRTLAESRGASICEAKPKENSADELLAVDSFLMCCKKAAQEQKQKPKTSKKYESTDSKILTGSAAASLCEEYAPNELCAHHCIPVPGSYKCECNPGFKLMSDGRNCIEVVKNRCKPRNPCQHKCNDNGVEVKCSCRRGYQLMKDDKSCKDIDECQLVPPVCLPGTQCFNIQGSYRCIPQKKPANSNVEKGQCPPGFVRNLQNYVCDDVNECELLHPPCPSYLCENTIGGYKCDGVSGDPANLANNNNNRRPTTDDRCPQGFRTGLNEECEDVDECLLRKDDCNPLSQFCINTRGSFYCQNRVSKHCPPGFKIDPKTNKCEDIDECDEGQDICRADQICVNVPGEYDCKSKDDYRKRSNSNKCPEGMRKKPGSNICEDIDECLEGTHLCDQYQNCLNTNGSHECNCKLGFESDPITGACSDMNECATEQHNCIPGSQRCDNTVGSFLCIRITPCGTGYILHHTTGECEDIDECALGTHNCDRAGPEYHCVNHPGSFRCIKQRTTTSTTTATPEYEYEYYDSEEEVTDGNQTKSTQKPPENKPEVESTTTTTPKSPVPTDIPTLPDISDTNPTPTPTPTPETPYREPEQTLPNPPDPTLNAVDTDLRTNESTEPEHSSNIEPRQPEPFAPGPEEPPFQKPHTEQTPSTEPSAPEEPVQPFAPGPLEPNQPYQPEVSKPEQPQEPAIGPNINESIPTEYEPPKTTYKPEPSPTPPQVVYVEVGKETAVVQGEKRNDGSVVVNTQDLPKNEWTKVHERPSNCQIGFDQDEYGACVDIDECVTGRHSCIPVTETCKNTMGGYLCDCAPGYRRHLVSGICDVIITTPATTSTSPPPTVPVPTTTQKSRNYFWGYPDFRSHSPRPFQPRTLCDVGYHFNSQTGKCDDINECINGQAHCAEAEICMNTDGGYRCECPPNWRLDEVRHRCVPIRKNSQFPSGYWNEPSATPKNSEPDPGQNIYMGTKYVEPKVTQLGDRGSVVVCPSGYKLAYDNTCEDIDECSTGEPCGAMLCTNLRGGYVCSCPPGHKLVADNRCEDVDECSLGGNMPICSQNADCANTIGSYQCRCHTGFRSAPVNDKVCVDVDECTESQAGSLCQHRCNNVWGGYRCSCHRGYRLGVDNSTCVDVDECTEFKSKIPCVGRCLNEPGSYRCTCPPGYRLSEDKRSCIDIDECETGDAPCSKGGTFGGTSDVCLNTRGGYRCHRIQCPPGYKLESKHRCTRIEKICPPADWDCAHQPTTYSYNFITFVSKLYIPASKVDLFTMRGPAWPNAKMRFQLRLVDVNAPPTVKDRADINAFLLVQTANQAVMSLVRSLEGPQSIELELSMDLYNGDQFGGIAVARLYIYVSEYEF